MANNSIDNIENFISKDIWNVIRDNYERGSYTASITNLIQYINEIIQDKANLENVDNTTLIEQALSFKSSKPPKIQVNKLQTRTEKDIQEGILHLLKGACLAIRNPRSHERYSDDKLTADRIILFYDYVLDFIRKSEQPKLVDDWIKFIFDNNFVETAKYASATLKEIPPKKRYDLLVNIFRNREIGTSKNLSFIVNKLIDSISPEEHDEFIDGLNKELIECKNDAKLITFFKLFPPLYWHKIQELPKLRIENLVLESILKANGNYENYGYNEYEYVLSTESILSIAARNHIPEFDTYDIIIRNIKRRAQKDNNSDLFEHFFMNYFSEYIENT